MTFLGAGGDGGGGGFAYANPIDEPPSSPPFENIEFDAATGLQNWTVTNGLVLPSVYDIGVTTPSWLTAVMPTTESLSLDCASVAAGDVSYTMKCASMGYTNYHSVHLTVYDAGKTNAVRYTCEHVNAFGLRLHIQNSGSWAYNTAGWNLYPTEPLYLHMQRNSGTWAFWFSVTGNSWTRFTTNGKTLTVASVELLLNGSSTPFRCAVDWLRRDFLTL